MHCDPHFAPDGTCWCPCDACMPPARFPGGNCGCHECPCWPARLGPMFPKAHLEHYTGVGDE